MKPIHVTIAWFGLTLALACSGQTSPMEQAAALESRGKFKEATVLLTAALTNANAVATTKKLEFEIDRLERIRRDYSYTKESLFTDLKKSVRDVTEVEFEKWISEGRFDVREIDGERRFMGSSVSNLFFRYADVAGRRIPARDTTKKDRAIFENCLVIQGAAQTAGKPYVLPKRFRVTMTVSAKPNAAPAGETVRAWLPIPRGYAHQVDFDLRNAVPAVAKASAPNSPIRSVYLEQTALKDRATDFQIEYDYTAYGVRFDWKPEAVKAFESSDAGLQPYLREAPHVVFTPEIRALSQKLAEGEKNPALLAKRFYDWIAANIKYSYATEYSTIRNISDYCRAKGYGDCGQEALLFITLCRLNGIPARWQSGWYTATPGKTIHDWCEIYLAPYGWMPVDPYMGIWAMRYATTLTAEQQRTVRDFYFGGLDQNRMAANSDHNQQLDPPKNSMRSDDVDFQRGELEWGRQNIYFDQYSYDLELKEIKPPHLD